MKKTTPTKVITVYAEDKKGLLGQILMFLNRKDYPVHQVSAARTDIAHMVLITLEVSIPDDRLPLTIAKLENIIEVYHVSGFTGFEAELWQAGYFHFAKDFANSRFFALMQKHGATIAGVTTEGFVIQKTGTATDLEVFYNLLDGPGLISYCRNGLIVPESLKMLQSL
ncbi:acetolactate synthase small subunit [Mucilaginibacter sp. cycad4]|uniref:acetolactate synthase small subunit n=1 Tax=Mucilaginibacter sp. cycad4 TaxID=3342096 RepID=UPI002AAAA7AA|nr:acetolactate synthase small subunit [Mucilaginibacter gossypii]WPV01644.1 acetolactate synthase small subunit [Mucilaginibacter gossypii]